MVILHVKQPMSYGKFQSIHSTVL